MKQKLAEIYLKPSGNLFRLLSYLNRYRLSIFLLIFLSGIIYPLSTLFYDYYQLERLKHSETQVTEQLNQQKALLDSLNQYQKKRENSTQFANINQLLKSIIEEAGGMVENLQWQFGEQIKIQLVIQQRTDNLLYLIEKINQLNQVRFSEITLLKLNENQRIRLDAILVLQ